jgi:hypothetical protein
MQLTDVEGQVQDWTSSKDSGQQWQDHFEELRYKKDQVRMTSAGQT